MSKASKPWSPRRSGLRARYRFNDDDFVFLSVAAINHQKNHMGAVRAFHASLPEVPRARPVILGPKYEEKLFVEIEGYIRRHGLEEHIIYAGESLEAYSYFAMADAFVFASFLEGARLLSWKL